MRFQVLGVALAAVVLLSSPASASLPYYNQDLGYTIWLPGGWTEVPDAALSGFSPFQDGVAALENGWEAGYVLNAPARVCLLVSKLPGRVVSKETIGNFNRFVVRGLRRAGPEHVTAAEKPCPRLTKASFCERKNMLRLEMDGVDVDGGRVTTIVYIVYTSTGMLKFVGLVEPGDDRGVSAVDEAVSGLYLDYGLRQSH
jgi:hypothetical protein